MKDERVDCMACLVIDDDILVPGVVTDEDTGVTHALTTVALERHYRLCDFDDHGVLLPGTYTRRHVKYGSIQWTTTGKLHY